MVLAASPLLGTATQDCAPWDGDATRLKLPLTSNTGQLTIFIYQSAAKLSSASISFRRNDAGIGMTSRCTSACEQALETHLQFQKFTLPNDLIGTAKLRFKDGWFTSSFRATWIPSKMPCG
jgi:hypothetical protein